MEGLGLGFMGLQGVPRDQDAGLEIQGLQERSSLVKVDEFVHNTLWITMTPPPFIVRVLCDPFCTT